MILFSMCTLFYIILVVFELIPIYKDKDKKLFWVYSLVLISTYIIHMLIIIGIKVPSPADPIEYFIITILGLK